MEFYKYHFEMKVSCTAMNTTVVNSYFKVVKAVDDKSAFTIALSSAVDIANMKKDGKVISITDISQEAYIND